MVAGEASRRAAQRGDGQARSVCLAAARHVFGVSGARVRVPFLQGISSSTNALDALAEGKYFGSLLLW